MKPARTGWRTVRSAALLAAEAWILFAGSPAAAQGGGSSEYAVKAAFLYHFAQFVEWPDAAFRDRSSPFVYCTVGGDPFSGALETTLSGKSVSGREFQVRHLKQVPEARGCHLLFLGEGDSKLAAAFAGAVKGTPVLVVGDSSKSLEEGAMIAFLLDDNKVRFEVNLDNAEKAKLRISAKLLALAKGVVGGAKRGA